MKRRILIPLSWGLSLLAVALPVDATTLSFEVLGGSAWNPPAPLLLRQAGEPDLRFDADFSTRPFEIPIYWVMRVTWWRGDLGIAVDLNHHKLQIEDPPEEVRNLTITHGYNHLTLQVRRRVAPLKFVVGMGVVLAHPETNIRGRVHPENNGLFASGKYLAGPVLLAGAGWDLRLLGPLFATLEGRITLSSIDAPIEGGDLSLRHAGFHGAAGVGLRF